METLRGILNWAFPYLLYPLVVMGVFVVIGDMLRMLVSAASDRLGKIRRVTGAVLPWVILVFLFTVDPNAVDSLRPWIEKLSWLGQLVIGAVVGALMMEFGKLLMKSEGDGPASFYALVLSGFGAFLVLMIMGRILQSLNFALMGLVVAGAVHVIFRGPPEVDRTPSQPADRTETT